VRARSTTGGITVLHDSTISIVPNVPEATGQLEQSKPSLVIKCLRCSRRLGTFRGVDFILSGAVLSSKQWLELIPFLHGAKQNWVSGTPSIEYGCAKIKYLNYLLSCAENRNYGRACVPHNSVQYSHSCITINRQEYFHLAMQQQTRSIFYLEGKASSKRNICMYGGPRWQIRRFRVLNSMKMLDFLQCYSQGSLFLSLSACSMYVN